MQSFPTIEEIREAELEAKVATESGTYVPNSRGYIQRYDLRGYPQNLASHNLRKQSRRAQNSVLAIFGVCSDHTGYVVRPLADIKRNLPIDPAKIQMVRKENLLGWRIHIAEQCMFLLARCCLIGVRHRLQVS